MSTREIINTKPEKANGKGKEKKKSSLDQQTLVDPEYKYADEASIKEDLKCPICLGPLVEPVQVECQCFAHYCSTCCPKEKCSKCRGNFTIVTRLTMPRDKIILNQLNELKVSCSNSGNACDWVGERGNLKDHLGQCLHYLCPSRKQGCVWKGLQISNLRSTLISKSVNTLM